MRTVLLIGTVSHLSYAMPGLAADGVPKPSAGTKEGAAAGMFGLDKVWSIHLTIQPDQAASKVNPKESKRKGK